MIITSAEFVKSAVKPDHYPPPALPEIAFVGRSNVGKSSLINTLVNRRHLVKTSSTPGRTQLINFFEINESFLFVDLPGYGYAKVPDHVKKTWAPMLEAYFKTRKNLKGIVMIMDIRRTQGQDETEMIRWFTSLNIPVVPVLTKTDKLKKTKQISQQRIISDTLSMGKDHLILFSTKTRQGKDAILEKIEKLIFSNREQSK